LLKSLVAQHRQTWKLQEYHLLAPVSSVLDSGSEIDTDGSLSIGDPIQAHFPVGTEIKSSPDGVEVRDPGKTKPLFYRKASCFAAPTTDGINGDSSATFIRDVLIIGEVGISLVSARP
jgi:hypothetical protein